MRFQTVVPQLKRLPLFDSGVLSAYADDTTEVQHHLADWVRAGKVVQLKRGLYALAKPYRSIPPHPFLIANRLVTHSYVSLQMALGYYGLIPEHVAVVTSITTEPSKNFSNEFGRFTYQHIPVSLFCDFRHWQVTETTTVCIATPEKAMLDLIYSTVQGDSSDYLRGLRLQNLDLLDRVYLNQLVKKLNRPKLWRALSIIEQLIDEEAEMYQTL